MSQKSILARHRATPARSTVVSGLSTSAKSNALALGRPALIIAAASGLLFGVGAPAHAGAHAPDGSTGATVGAAAPAPAPVRAAAAVAPAAVAPAAGRVHVVVSGDTLGAISARYGVTLNSVLAANNLAMTSIIYPGNQIQIPAAGQAAAPTLSLASTSIKPVAAPAPAPAPAAASGTGAALLASAYAQIGATQDCTILVERALRSIGKSVGDLAPTQFFQYGTVVGTPAPGDLVITSGHIGIYAGNGQVVSSGMNYVNATLVHPLSWLSGYSFVRVA
ncbi:C40 family peptidase [Arthrobacter rhizosphaerae]|uniref:C40 family peptidase n=1 Tax=Arthrobacter rhizosphaerae TaxID=2855490 RepID=UPI001FF35C87|nr:LysM domain-containing protein [Arthrobacter rhizosphaerae]